MIWRPVEDADVPQVEAFLLDHIETSVFLVSNLRTFGPRGAAHEYAMRYWMTGEPVEGVIAHSTGGVIMAQWPRDVDWAEALAVIDAPVTGVIGHADQMQTLLQAAGLRDRPTNLDADEALYALDLNKVIPQDGPGVLHPIAEAMREVLIPWRTDYAINTLGEPEETAPARAKAEITAYIAADSHRVLGDAGELLSMTGFNARVDDVVQVGGVYTPPDKRGRGLARRALALHLAEARDAGATRAILFANGPSAMAAYEAVGFEKFGRFALIMFTEGHTI